MDPMLEGASWLDEELAGSTFADAMLVWARSNG
jgi:hypothetical protein